MKYTSVEVKQHTPFFRAGYYPVHELNAGPSILSNNGQIHITIAEAELFPDFFRLISEPEKEKRLFNLYARCVKSFQHTDPVDSEIIEGRVYKVLGFTPDMVSVNSKGYSYWGQSYFTPSTEGEYLKQEEGKKPWRPKNKEVYFIIASDGSIDHTRYNPKWESDSLRIEIGNCFRTEEAAEHFRDNFLKPTYAKYSEVYSTLPEEVK